MTATSLTTGLTLTRESTADGTYSLPLLPVGDYKIDAQVTGFQSFTRTGVRLAVNDIANIDITLSVGTVAESIEVTGSLRCWKPRPAHYEVLWTSSVSLTCR